MTRDTRGNAMTAQDKLYEALTTAMAAGMPRLRAEACYEEIASWLTPCPPPLLDDEVVAIAIPDPNPDRGGAA